jgi:hypothetical protein
VAGAEGSGQHGYVPRAHALQGRGQREGCSRDNPVYHDSDARRLLARSNMEFPWYGES